MEYFKIPIIEAYRSLAVGKIIQPYWSGYWRHQGTYLGDINPHDGSFSIILDDDKIWYMNDVLAIYMSRDDDILERTTFEVYEHLNRSLHGGRSQYDKDYMIAFRSVLYGAETNIEREKLKARNRIREGIE